MPTQDVPAREWTEFLTSFSRRHRAWLATIEDAAHRSVDAERDARPLAAVIPEVEGTHVRAIEISFAPDAGVESVRIENPTAVRLRQTEAGADRALEIVDDAGRCTRIGFRAAAVPEMVDGVAPGEI
jgi:hypothetical protein